MSGCKHDMTYNCSDEWECNLCGCEMDTAEMGQYEHDEDVSKLRAEIERLKDIIINLGYEPAIGGGK